MTPHQFSPASRLHFSWEYRRFFDQSKVFRLSECTIFRIPNQLPHNRLGITLKARGSSVERNRVKRTLREAFRTQQGLAPASGDVIGYDFNVVIPNSKKMGHPFPLRLRKCLLDAIPFSSSKL